MTPLRRGPVGARDHSDRLSRFLALVLRHKPETAGVTLDSAGFVDIDALARGLAQQPGWSSVTPEAIRTLAEYDPRRYEIVGDRIRARYGHSVPIDAPGRPVTPPEWLYHGTSPDALEAIREHGLHPADRQFVHLSATRQDALAVGQRHSPDAVVVTVLARRASDDGVIFYQASPGIYLTRALSPQFLSLPDANKPA